MLTDAAPPITDPVCGMTVDPAKTAHHAGHEGVSFHFCSAGCRAKFVADHWQYLAARPQPVVEAASDTVWTCPMHPEIRRSGPGACPICGMTLEPAAPALDDGPNPELVDFTRRLSVSAVLAVPLLIVSMGAEMLGLRIAARRFRRGCNSRSAHRSYCGRACPSSGAAVGRCARGISTCSLL